MILERRKGQSKKRKILKEIKGETGQKIHNVYQIEWFDISMSNYRKGKRDPNTSIRSVMAVSMIDADIREAK